MLRDSVNCVPFVPCVSKACCVPSLALLCPLCGFVSGLCALTPCVVRGAYILCALVFRSVRCGRKAPCAPSSALLCPSCALVARRATCIVYQCSLCGSASRRAPRQHVLLVALLSFSFVVVPTFSGSPRQPCCVPRERLCLALRPVPPTMFHAFVSFMAGSLACSPCSLCPLCRVRPFSVVLSALGDSVICAPCVPFVPCVPESSCVPSLAFLCPLWGFVSRRAPWKLLSLAALLSLCALCFVSWVAATGLSVSLSQPCCVPRARLCLLCALCRRRRYMLPCRSRRRPNP